MRMQISLPPLLAEHLRQLALVEHRDPKQQAEILLYRAVEQAMLELLPARKADAFLEEVAHE